MDHSILINWCVILAAATGLVALFQWLRLSPILGYLATGLLVGPSAIGVLEDGPSLRFLAELGVVLLMFTIGLEFSLSRFLSAKQLVLGIGGGQMIMTSLILGGLAAWLGATFVEAFVLAVALAMSSTAIVLKQLGEQNELASPHGRISAGVLLFQDIAAVPILVCLPVLAADSVQLGPALGIALLKVVLVFVGLVIAGRYLLPQVLNGVAKARSLELFMLTALLMAFIAAAISHLAGLSPTLGAFMAGTLLGETRFKHQIEADIRPFRDLMLGIFFLSIGMQLDPSVFVSRFDVILLILMGLLFVKALIFVPVVLAFKHRAEEAWHSAITLAHGGEFGLLLASSALAIGLLEASLVQPALAAIIVSMLLAPLMMRISAPLAKFINKKNCVKGPLSTEAEIARYSENLQEHVVVCGYGRLGQNVNQILQAEGINVLALDLDPEKVHEAFAAGEPVMYGNATHPGILRAVGLERAKALAITLSDTLTAKRVITLAKSIGFNGPILVRSPRGRDEEGLSEENVAVFPEGLETSLSFAGQLMIMLEVPASKVEKHLNQIRAEDYAVLRQFFHASVAHRAERQQLDYPTLLRSVIIHAEHHAAGKTLEELQMPVLGVEVVDVRRGAITVPGRLLDSKLKDGDVVVLSGQQDLLDAAMARLIEGS
ncbi:sodium/hydrogen exchanger family protein [Methylophaga thalassica]|uniref:Sodium/hydrogen exchanger family protein n=1 Tax=Methylophaga thalassica TaxID=40223 RepID=A0ABQ5TSR9_9GAMM|nr:cation:proton antiporter [Methylophaga thalassica]GLP98481.1 sodium/hydrogen exchanger family protein [Methylophaga thalassica]